MKDKTMKSIFAIILLFLQISPSFAQEVKLFKGTLKNQQYNIYLNINLYDKNITIPQQEIFGEVDGYLGDYQDSRKWIITASEIIDKNNAKLQIINDYGSEDLTANLKIINDSTYTLEQTSGSNIKIARNRKWIKLPSKLNFKKQ